MKEMLDIGLIYFQLTIFSSHIKLEYFLEWSSLLFVVGGTYLALLFSFPFRFCLQGARLVKVLVSKDKFSMVETIGLLEKLSEQSRKSGLLSLEAELSRLENSFLKKGMTLLVDGHSKEKVRNILKNDIDQMNKRHGQRILYYEKAGTYAVSVGILGTLIQVILILRQLSMAENPIDTMIMQIAVAFLPLLYGTILAYLVYIPIANKLIIKHEKENTYKNLIRDGIEAIQAGDSPKQIREHLASYLEEKKRIHDI